VVFGLKTFRQYLLGRHFSVRTDHAALPLLRRTPEPIGQLARWLAFIEQYSFDVVYRKGAKHTNADGLSRRPSNEDAPIAVRVVKGVEGSLKTVESINPSDTSAGEGPTLLVTPEHQQQDSELGALLTTRMQQTEQPNLAEMQNAPAAAKTLLAQWVQLEVHNGLVYRRWGTKRGELLQLIVPQECRGTFLDRVHGGRTGGHFGVSRTMDQV